MTIKQKRKLVHDTMRTTARVRNLRVAKEVEDQAKQFAETEPLGQTQTPLEKKSDFKGKV